MSTAQKILNLLNREELTVSELADRLAISRNSAHLQVTKMEAAGTLEKSLPEAAKKVGKPAFRYRVVASREDTFSSAYKPVLTGLVETIAARLPASERDQLLRQAGRTLARSSGLVATSDFRADLNRALDAVNSLGAMAELSGSDSTPMVRCHTCPVASLVHKEPSICNLVASFFSQATDKPVTVRCRREGTVVCGFSFDDAEDG